MGPPNKIWYHYVPRRTGAVPKELPKEYRGIVQTDAYAGDNFVFMPDRAKSIACPAHVRRKFIESVYTIGNTLAELHVGTRTSIQEDIHHYIPRYAETRLRILGKVSAHLFRNPSSCESFSFSSFNARPFPLTVSDCPGHEKLQSPIRGSTLYTSILKINRPLRTRELQLLTTHKMQSTKPSCLDSLLCIRIFLIIDSSLLTTSSGDFKPVCHR